MARVRAEVESLLRRPYTIELEYGETPKDGVLARVAEWPGCMTAGTTRAEAIANLEDAMRQWASAALEMGQDISEPMAKYGGRVLVQMPRTLHRDVVRRADEEGVSMNGHAPGAAPGHVARETTLRPTWASAALS